MDWKFADRLTKSPVRQSAIEPDVEAGQSSATCRDGSELRPRGSAR